MKKVLFASLALFYLTLSCNSTDETFNETISKDISNEKLKEIRFDAYTTMYDFVTKSKENINIGDDLILTKYSDLNNDFDKKNYKIDVELHNLNNDRDILYSLEMINKKDFTNCYILYNKKYKEFITYFINVKKDQYIEVYNKDKEFITSFVNVDGFVKLTEEKVSNNNISSNKSCFQYCMDYVEDKITDDLIGWAAWNLSPGVQIAAAIGCDRSCNPKPGF
nr:hypothetical protein [uncultured Flavobacterium sp.]